MQTLLSNHYKSNIEEENGEYIKWYFTGDIPKDFMKPFTTSKNIEMERFTDPTGYVNGFYIWWYK